MGKDYILKAGDREKLLININVSKALHKQGFTSSIPIPTKTGSERVFGRQRNFHSDPRINIYQSPIGLEIIVISSVKNTVKASHDFIRL